MIRGGTAIALVSDDGRFREPAGALLEQRGLRTARYPVADDTCTGLCRDRPDLLIGSLASGRSMPLRNLLTLLRLDQTMAAIPFLPLSPNIRLLAEKLGQLGAVGCDVLEESFAEHQRMAKGWHRSAASSSGTKTCER